MILRAQREAIKWFKSAAQQRKKNTRKVDAGWTTDILLVWRHTPWLERRRQKVRTDARLGPWPEGNGRASTLSRSESPACSATEGFVLQRPCVRAADHTRHEAGAERLVLARCRWNKPTPRLTSPPDVNGQNSGALFTCNSPLKRCFSVAFLCSHAWSRPRSEVAESHALPYCGV